MRTYKELQDIVLSWMADPDDEGLLRTLVKDAINRAHQNLLNDDRYDFMLWPRNETLTVVSGQKNYSLHPRFGHPLFFYNPTTNEYMEEISPRGLMESEEDWNDGAQSEPDRFMLTGLSKVIAQPSAAGVVTVTASGGTESADNSFVIRGTYNGAIVTETLSSGSAWSSIVGSQPFAVIDDVTKVGESWSRLVTLTVDATTVLTLGASSLGAQYRQFELLATPTSAATILYRFYKQPRQLVLDNDVPDLPAGFDDILVYQALMAVHGYTRATQDEMTVWAGQVSRLTNVLQQTYRSTRTMGGRPIYTRYIPRV